MKSRVPQSRKGTNSRYRILEATLDCLVETGYSNTSITTISERAGLSRGAVQFHFPTKLSAIQATIVHVMQRRLDTYRADMARIPRGTDFIQHATRSYWRQVQQPEFIAQQELSLAARTDPELAKALKKAYRHYVRQSRVPFLEEFPGWRKQGRRYETAANLAQYLIEGMSWGHLNGHLDDTAVKDLLSELGVYLGGTLDSRRRQ